MQILLIAIALIWTFSGFLLFSHPDGFRDSCRQWFPAARAKRLAPLPAAVGAVLVAGAFSTPALFHPLLVIGVLGIAKGVYLFLTPVEKLARTLDDWFYRADGKTLRRYGIIVFVVGIALLAFVA